MLPCQNGIVLGLINRGKCNGAWKKVAYWHCGNSWGCRLQIFNNWENDLEASTKLKGVKCILALKQQETPNKNLPTKHSIKVYAKATITTRNKEALSLWL